MNLRVDVVRIVVMKKTVMLAISHSLVLGIGIALGIYLLPILIAPEAPEDGAVQQVVQEAMYSTEFIRELDGSDWLHWGEGMLSISADRIAFMGELAPGPDYRLYLAPEFVTNERAFQTVKQQSVQVGDVKIFDNFILDLPQGVRLENYTTVVVWCETFGQFITSGRYR